MAASIARPAAAITFLLGAKRARRHAQLAVVVLFGAVWLAVMMAPSDPLMPPLWFLGIAAGFTLQRSRFCFASAFRDLFLFGSARMLKAILLGIAVATIGFAIIMYDEVPYPAFGALPQEAHVLPVGPSTAVAGLLFGFGMVIAGGCGSGSLYRVGEGYVASAVAVVGMVAGLGILVLQWNWLWDHVVRREPRLWMPAELGLGYSGAVVASLVVLLAIFLFLVWWEARNGVGTHLIQTREDPVGTFTERIGAMWRRVFVDGWSPAVGGATLGLISILLYSVHMPWGVTGELTRWATTLLDSARVGPGTLRGLDAIGGCAVGMADRGVFTHSFAMTVGLIVGSLIAALFSGEFKLRFPPQRRRYVQAFGGGILMGLGAGLAVGCTVGAFFSATASLSVSGWLFALALTGGAYLGVQTIRRIP